MKQEKYNIHKDFMKLKAVNLPIIRFLLPIENIMMELMYKITKTDSNINIKKYKIEGYKKGKISIEIYEPKGIKNQAPCLVYYHGGAFIYKITSIHKKLISHYALQTPCKIVVVDYRLAPKYAFPYPVEDCYCALQWVYQNAEELCINPDKIAVGGDSAGGCLTASVSQIARDRNGPNICFQMMIYPCIDTQLITQSIKMYNDTPVFNSKKAKIMWSLYLKNGDFGMHQYASPIQAKSFSYLPPAYIETAEFDCLRDEGINYANKLKSGGIDVEVTNTNGTVHGFDALIKSEIVKETLHKRVTALQKAFRLF